MACCLFGAEQLKKINVINWTITEYVSNQRVTQLFDKNKISSDWENQLKYHNQQYVMN